LNYGPQGLEATSYLLRSLIVEAYQSPSDHLIVKDSRGDALLDSVYDVIAKAERPVPKDQLRLMLQTLLEDRFKLAVHWEEKVEPIYRLIVGKQGQKLQRSVAEMPNPHLIGRPDLLEFREATVAQFCRWLTRSLNARVVDATGIEGVYDFRLVV